MNSKLLHYHQRCTVNAALTAVAKNAAAASSSSSSSSSPQRYNIINNNFAGKQQQQQRSFSTQQQQQQQQQQQRTVSWEAVDSVESGTNAIYIESMEEQWKRDPSSVDPYWRQYFESIQSNGSRQLPASFKSLLEYNLSQAHNKGSPAAAAAAAAGVANADELTSFKSEIVSLIRSYQVLGHSVAKLDPLGIFDADLDSTVPKELSIEHYHFSAEDFNSPATLGIGGGEITGFLNPQSSLKLSELHSMLNATYCGTIGFEYMHILNRAQCNWIRERIELPTPFTHTAEEKKVILKRLMDADMFEGYLANKFPTAKRFGLEGCDSFIPGVQAFVDAAAENGAESFVIGMAHRGRLNMLANVLGKPLEIIFSEFQGTTSSDWGTGDVKYHLGASSDIETKSGKKVHMTLCANPSHLEAVNPVVTGKTRAKQYEINDTERKKIVPILVHGDASFAGQGVVYETMGMSGLTNFTVGGTMHIVINNQIGFTTNPRQSRSTPYCTDLAKYLNAPIFHVNGDDVESVARVCRLAAEWRQQWGRDVVVDIIGYRKYGHNELDQPMFTQPIMYNAIAKHTPVLDQYTTALVSQNVVPATEIENMKEKVKSKLDKALQYAKDAKNVNSSEWLGKESQWREMIAPRQYSKPQRTGVALKTLQEVGHALCTVPQGFALHRGLQRVLDDKRKMIDNGEGLDWATAEALAFGSLLREGHHIRLSGQDVERGTFSHRHAVVTDQNTEDKYCMLNGIPDKKADIHINNSHLSEYGVLGFEYGFSMESPKNLVLWEAQFGDFSNGAQTMIDQFLSCGEEKWLKMSGLVMLLPHGYEGQGPEHSNTRIERFLQLSNEDPDKWPEIHIGEDRTRQIQEANYQVVNCTTPANYFHVLRRQMKRNFRKPLIVATPKSLLRYKYCVSTLADMAEGTRFQRVIPENAEDEAKLVAPEKVRRVVFCSGKVYYDLWLHRSEKQVNDVAIVRVEQLAPFPFEEVAQQLNKYPNAEIVWCQEEPQNYGAWHHFYFRCLTALRHIGQPNRIPRYAGRKPSSSPSTGFPAVHKAEQEALVVEALH